MPATKKAGYIDKVFTTGKVIEYMPTFMLLARQVAQ